MTQEFVTLPREVVEHVLKAMGCGGPLKQRQAMAALHAALEQPQGEQEPAGWQKPVGFIRQVDIEHLANTPSDWGWTFGQKTSHHTVPLYTRPQPKREPLKNERIRLIESSTHFHESRCWVIRFARAIEAAHNIK